MTLDEIYESFIWDASYTDEEYESKISVGINEAEKFKNKLIKLKLIPKYQLQSFSPVLTFSQNFQVSISLPV